MNAGYVVHRIPALPDEFQERCKVPLFETIDTIPKNKRFGKANDVDLYVDMYIGADKVFKRWFLYSTKTFPETPKRGYLPSNISKHIIIPDPHQSFDCLGAGGLSCGVLRGS